MLYTISLYLHILSAIVATGPLFALFPLLNRMQKAPEDQLKGFILSIQGILRAIANGGHFLVITGLLLIFVSGWSFSDSWIIVTLVIMACSLLFMARAYKPSMALTTSGEFTQKKFIQMTKMATYKYVLLMGTLLWLMVAKPEFW